MSLTRFRQSDVELDVSVRTSPSGRMPTVSLGPVLVSRLACSGLLRWPSWPVPLAEVVRSLAFCTHARLPPPHRGELHASLVGLQINPPVTIGMRYVGQTQPTNVQGIVFFAGPSLGPPVQARPNAQHVGQRNLPMSRTQSEEQFAGGGLKQLPVKGELAATLPRCPS